MAIHISTRYEVPGVGIPQTIEVGTKADDDRLSATNLYVRMPGSTKIVLTQTETLDLASVLLRTVMDLMAADQP